MAELSVLTIALQTIRDLLIEEAKFLLGVSGELEGIDRELQRMKNFLEYADAKQDEDTMLHHRVVEIRGIADEVEDVLQTFAMEVALRRDKPRGLKNVLQRYACIFSECIAVHKVGSEIVSIKAKITNLSNNLPIYDIDQGQSSNSIHEKQRWQRMTSPQSEKDFVGMKEDITKLVFHLVRKEKQQHPRVVSICGMGGLGKTSLAKKVYNHPVVRQRFDRFAWVCITQQWQPRDILQEILSGLGSDNSGIANLTDQQLVEKLFEVQDKKRCLVVVDDIWSTDAWDTLKHAFPDGEKDSKVLLTTRDKEVALYADPQGFLHEPKCLGEEEGWDLLQKKAFPTRDGSSEFVIDPSMEDLGREMVRRCGGLPLAVVVLGGILVRKHTSNEWKKVLENIKTYLTRGERIGKEDNRGVSAVLALSYKNLPYKLKPCFLYLGQFAEDSEIDAERLYHLWVAGRFISIEERLEGETMVDVADRYLGELAQRCMVQVRVKMISTPKRSFESCRLHDLMRDLCLSKAKEENLFKVVTYSNESDYSHGNEPPLLKEESSFSTHSTKTRRLAIYDNSYQHGNDEVGGHMEIQRAQHIQSLLYSVKHKKLGLMVQRFASTNTFKFLRVLDIEGAAGDAEGLSEAIGKLTQLRYLGIRSRILGPIELPSSIVNLGYMETLYLQTIHGFFVVPNVLWKLQRLRHLYLPSQFRNRKGDNKVQLHGLSNLETLVNFNSNYCDGTDLLTLNNLRTLKAEVWRILEEVGLLATTITSPNSLLQHSNISIHSVDFNSEEELTTLRNIIGCHHLYELHIEGNISKLPEHTNFSPHLTKLILESCELYDDLMPTLEKLPSLIHLEIGIVSFMGKEMVCSATGFLQLTLLHLRHLQNFEIWRVDKGAFPKLSHLEISNCWKLKMIPDGLTYVTTLEELAIPNMPDILQDRVRVVNGKEGEDYYKVRHVPFIRF